MNEIIKPDERLQSFLNKQRLRKDTVYVPSVFLLDIFVDGSRYLVNNLTKQCFETSLPKDHYSPDEIEADGDLFKLMEGHFIVPRERDELSNYKSIFTLLRALSEPKGFSNYTILLTTACNARCTYCYEEGMKPIVMSLETADKVVDYISVSRDPKTTVKITWFGGEPLLKPDTASRICRGLKNRSIDFESTAITNGSLITEDLARLMTEEWKLKSIQLSMDGGREDYAKKKNYINNEHAYDTVIDAAALLASMGITVTIRSNVDRCNIDSIGSFIDDLSDSIEHKENVTVYLSPLYGERAGDNDIELWQKSIEKTELIEKAGFSSTMLIGFGLGFRTSICKGGRTGIAVSPDGGLYLCEHCDPHTRIGDVTNGITDEIRRREFLSIEHAPEKCLACPFLPDCTLISSCPIKDNHCRELRTMMAERELKKMIKN